MNIVTVSADEPTQKTYDANDTHQHETTSYLGNSMNLYVASPNHQIGAEIELIIYTDFSNEIVDITFSGDGFVLTNYFEVAGNEIHFSVTHTPKNEEPFLSVNILLDNGDSFTGKLFGIIRDELLFVDPHAKYLAESAYKSYSSNIKSNESQTNTTMSLDTAFHENDVSTNARSGNYNTSITGQIVWEDFNGNEQPLRFCKILLTKTDGLIAYQLYEGYTDKNGEYYIEFNNDIFDGMRNLIIFVELEGEDFAVLDSYDSVYYDMLDGYDEIAALNNVTEGHHTIEKYTYPDENHVNNEEKQLFYEALQVHQAVTCAAMYYKEMKLEDITYANVVYPHDENNSGCFYMSSHLGQPIDTIYILGNTDTTGTRLPSYASWDVITHEYGHHVAHCEGIEDSPNGQHSMTEYVAEHYLQHYDDNAENDNCGNKCGLTYPDGTSFQFSEEECKYNGDALSWSEGYATFYGELAQQYFKDNYVDSRWNNEIYTFADYSYFSYRYSHYHFDRKLIEENDFRFKNAEIEVYRILFDLYDDGAVKITEDVETFDKVSCGHRGIWEYIIKSGELIDTDGDGKTDYSTKPKTLYQFVEYLKSSKSGFPKSQLSNLNAILAEHGLATEAPIINTISASTPYVDFEWKSSVSTTYYSAYKFQVNFYDSSYNLIGSTEPQNMDFESENSMFNGNRIVINRGTITINNQLWQIIMTYPSNFYVSVVMYECNGNINNPVTDPHTTSFESPYTMYLSPGHVHSYTHSYSKNNSTNHKAYCICGAYTLESHFFISVGLKTSCRDCGYITTGNVPVIRPTSIVTNDENCAGILPETGISGTYYAENKKRSNTL
jgi:hypothetical protein